MRSADGTRIRAWWTRTAGPDVLLCPGLGTMPEAWPALLAPTSGVRVHSWYHRGTMGSTRPADESRITLADHTDDAVAVLDAAGLKRCVVLGWSMGVTVATELALRHPERVTGLLLITGAPGDSFEAVLGLPGLPPELRRLLGRGGATVLRAVGPLLDAVLHRVPVNAATTFLLRHSGLLSSVSAPDTIGQAVRQFFQHDWTWYFTLALALGAAPRQDLTGISCPTTVLAGRYDLLASPESVRRPLGPLPQARLRVLPNTHFLPLESPRVVAEELHLLLDRVDAVRRAMHDEEPPPPRKPRYRSVRGPLTPGSRRRA
ncbi:alpha/beta hydrolase [Solihabitans fulvus]|uniref:Alpha/beta hydrolase n=1 Tax=Solihabitans fulvus TaxID=1892852 RepID=A0A5B2WSH9_9PSEU|nr:alpha/beta hydrolase [Solihabitans fulvus]KAA2253516.1 alpha/beta hydrolase [Solihabitans fulvus]